MHKVSTCLTTCSSCIGTTDIEWVVGVVNRHELLLESEASCAVFILHLRRGPSLASGRSQRWRVKLRERSCRTSAGQTLDVFLLILNDFEVNKIVRTHGAGRGITKKQEEKKDGYQNPGTEPRVLPAVVVARIGCVYTGHRVRGACMGNSTLCPKRSMFLRQRGRHFQSHAKTHRQCMI